VTDPVFTIAAPARLHIRSRGSLERFSGRYVRWLVASSAHPLVSGRKRALLDPADAFHVAHVDLINEFRVRDSAAQRPTELIASKPLAANMIMSFTIYERFQRCMNV
jgi:hypothetical protein